MTLLAQIVTYRDRMRERWSPPWMQTGNNEKLMYAVAVLVDTLGDALVAGLALRYPGLYTYESLPVIGRERRIARGPNESDATYAERLRLWLDAHRGRGGPYALLAQLYAYYAPSNFVAHLIYRSGRHFRMAADGTITRDIQATFGPDMHPDRHAKWFLFYEVASVTDIARVPREWNAAHCLGSVVTLPPGAECWSWPLGRKWNRHVKWNNPHGRGQRAVVNG